VAGITGLYLNISAQAATAGRKIQSLSRDIDKINDEIADLTTKLASAKSSRNMTTRAEELGFKLMDPNDAIYLEIPGYDPSTDLILAPPRVNMISESPIIRPSYKSSILDWFVDQFWYSLVGTTPAEEGQLP